jgi:fatty acid desaturase
MYSEKLIDTVETQVLIPQSEYIKKLKPLLPPEAFKPDASKLIIFFLNLGILILGWSIIVNTNIGSVYFFLLYLPLVLIMGNSIVALTFFAHEIVHNSVIKKSKLSYFISILALSVSLMPPTQWKNLHNLIHHNRTNSLADPDRNYLYEQPETWGKWLQNLFVPSIEVNPFWFVIGMPGSWLMYNFRNLTSVLLFNKKSVDYVPAAFSISKKDRLTIVFECFGFLGIHLTILAYLGFEPLKIILGYLIPLTIGHAGIMFYIYTHHLLCRMTSVNDPLINTVSIRVPKIFDRLHLNFSYHTEHHIFPSLNSDYYPLVQELIQIHYPGRMNLVSAGEAWQLLMKTPRHYKDELTLTDYSGKISVSCPFNR